MGSTLDRSLPRDDTVPSRLDRFRMRFATERACIAMLRRWRYPDGFRCPRCQGRDSWWLRRRRVDQCKGCGRQTSLTAGTVFHGSRKPLRTWFLAMFLFVSSKRGISALELARQLGLSYPTAWSWLHKLRVAMEDRHQELLSGRVEVDEAYVGGVEEGRGGRSLEKKSLVAAAVEVPKGRPGFGRIRLARLENASRQSLEDFVESQVEKGSLVCTDGFESYRGLCSMGYRHERVSLSERPERAHELFPGVHRVFSLLKRLLLGTYQGAVSRRHLQNYLGEFEFRFNRRTSGSRGLLFQRLLSAAVLDRSMAYHELVGGIEKGTPISRWAT